MHGDENRFCSLRKASLLGVVIVLAILAGILFWQSSRIFPKSTDGVKNWNKGNVVRKRPASYNRPRLPSSYSTTGKVDPIARKRSRFYKRQRILSSHPRTQKKSDEVRQNPYAAGTRKTKHRVRGNLNGKPWSLLSDDNADTSDRRPTGQRRTSAKRKKNPWPVSTVNKAVLSVRKDHSFDNIKKQPWSLPSKDPLDTYAKKRLTSDVIKRKPWSLPNQDKAGTDARENRTFGVKQKAWSSPGANKVGTGDMKRRIFDKFKGKLRPSLTKQKEDAQSAKRPTLDDTKKTAPWLVKAMEGSAKDA